jgi:signal transduction histidine kinase
VSVKLLVVDDNQFYCRMLQTTLTEWGYDVVTAGDGRQAWELLRGPDAPRLALIDWMMPEMDGLELCRRVRAAAMPGPPYLILLTAKGGKENIITGLEAGADDYIPKPFDLDELRARLRVGLRIVELQAALAARVRELEDALSGAQKMEAIGRLAGGVAHDFNNLLTIILNGADMVLAGDRLDDRQRELLHMVRQAGERGAGLTQQLLAFSRKQILSPEVLDLNALVADLQRMLRRLINEDIELATVLDPQPGRVQADRGQLVQVIMNLVVNARDAMPLGGRLTITTRNEEVAEPRGRGPRSVPPGSYVVLGIRDTGCGMDEGTLGHLFEPFFTTKGPGQGTGLGLATVYGIVKQSGGAIQVESAPNQGATFCIFLPRTEKELAPATGAGPAPARCPGRETVLLVEDEDQVRVMARRVLESNDYTVLEARDGTEALHIGLQARGPIHLMLTDVVLPRTSGPQLAGRLEPLRPNMKILFMSGYTDDAITQHSVASSGRPFLQKPFTAAGLAGKVREVLDS